MIARFDAPARYIIDGQSHTVRSYCKFRNLTDSIEIAQVRQQVNQFRKRCDCEQQRSNYLKQEVESRLKNQNVGTDTVVKEVISATPWSVAPQYATRALQLILEANPHIYRTVELYAADLQQHTALQAKYGQACDRVKQLEMQLNESTRKLAEWTTGVQGMQIPDKI
jgi:hypothetical protein